MILRVRLAYRPAAGVLGQMHGRVASAMCAGVRRGLCRALSLSALRKRAPRPASEHLALQCAHA
eukprot:scaffold8542_cov119-Isochrysis_galbana.AAC.4